MSQAERRTKRLLGLRFREHNQALEALRLSREAVRREEASAQSAREAGLLAYRGDGRSAWSEARAEIDLATRFAAFHEARADAARVDVERLADAERVAHRNHKQMETMHGRLLDVLRGERERTEQKTLDEVSQLTVATSLATLVRRRDF